MVYRKGFTPVISFTYGLTQIINIFAYVLSMICLKEGGMDSENF